MISRILFIILLVLCGFVIPGVLTAWNLYNCFAAKPKREKLLAVLGIGIGGLFYLGLHGIEWDEGGEWYEQLTIMEVHNSISTRYWGVVAIVLLLGLVSYFVLLCVGREKLPPLIAALCIAGLIVFNAFQIAYAIQISNRVEMLSLLLYVYHLNLFVLSVRVIYCQIRARRESLPRYAFLVCAALFFLVGVAEIILILTGEGADAPVKMFTETADWTFSQQIPPPPVDYDGHYLCTVAAAGHKKLVKPLRYGKRLGKVILVNRQLCVANAFEEVIRERMPLFHKRIRSFYDTYGYPVSRHITTPLRADVIYLLMKPLEWMFVIVLYLVDVHPEQRISRQYPYGRKDEQ